MVVVFMAIHNVICSVQNVTEKRTWGSWKVRHIFLAIRFCFVFFDNRLSILPFPFVQTKQQQPQQRGKEQKNHRWSVKYKQSNQFYKVELVQREIIYNHIKNPIIPKIKHIIGTHEMTRPNWRNGTSSKCSRNRQMPAKSISPTSNSAA